MKYALKVIYRSQLKTYPKDFEPILEIQFVLSQWFLV